MEQIRAKKVGKGELVSDILTQLDVPNKTEVVNIIDNEEVTVSKEVQDQLDKSMSMHWAIRRELANLKAWKQLKDEGKLRLENGIVFGDLFTGTALDMTLDLTRTKSINSLSVGQTTISVESVTDFQVGQEITIYDDVNLERVIISAIDVGTNTLTVSALINGYKSEANISRSMISLDLINNWIKFDGWLTSLGTTQILENDIRYKLSRTTTDAAVWVEHGATMKPKDFAVTFTEV